MKVVEALRAQVEALAIAHAASSASPYVTFSAGVATFSPDRDKTAADFVRRADEALYRAKALGRNRTVSA